MSSTREIAEPGAAAGEAGAAATAPPSAGRRRTDPPRTTASGASLGRIGGAVPGLAAGYEGDAWLDHWASDPWTHGSYAAFEPDQYTRYWGFADRPEGRVLFGGGHTSLSAQGFLAGAVASGERCAAEAAALSRQLFLMAP